MTAKLYHDRVKLLSFAFIFYVIYVLLINDLSQIYSSGNESDYGFYNSNFVLILYESTRLIHVFIYSHTSTFNRVRAL